VTTVRSGLTAEGVTLSFGGVYGLRDVDLAVAPGQWLGLIGPNGSGKTTLLNVLTGIYRAQAGTIRLDGHDLTSEPTASRGRRGVVRTFQHPQLATSLTIEENIMLGGRLAEARAGTARRRRSAAARSRARTAAELFGCEAYLDAMPDEAPYGVRKMAEVARAAAADPVVLLLDEPAAGLSREERSELIDALRVFSEGRTRTAVCLIEHDVPLVAALCPDLLVLDAGRMLASGPSRTVLADARVREAYLGNEVEASKVAADA
jgi:ABC-type branched-subunit amino acid transport system ATPase component